MFRFRSKVELEPAAASPDDLGIPGSSDDWLHDNLRAGIPEVWQAQSEEFTPHMLNLDLLGAVSFNKVADGERDIGAVLNAIGTDLLAVIPSEKADDSLSVNGARLRHVPLGYS